MSGCLDAPFAPAQPLARQTKTEPAQPGMIGRRSQLCTLFDDADFWDAHALAGDLACLNVTR